MLNNLIKSKKKSLYIYFGSGLIIVFLVVFIVKIFSGQTEVFSQVVDTVGGKQNLKTANDGRVNILIIGVDKRVSENNVENGKLTDTLILASINPDDKSYSLVSFPRDIWIDNSFGGKGVGYTGKINAVYATLGAEKLITVVENLTDQKIQYHVAVSFGGFIEAIDTLGGIEIYVENSFDDYAYPIEGKENELCGLEQKEADKIFELLNEQKVCTEDQTCVLFDDKNALDEAFDTIKNAIQKEYDNLVDTKSKSFAEYINLKVEKDENYFTYNDIKYELKIDDVNFPCRYESLHFAQGLQKFDGLTALKFARSRHAYGEEGSDFARAKRQQIVIDATKNKALSFSTFSNPIKLKNLFDNYQKNVETDIGFSDAQAMYGMLSSLTNSGSFVLSITDDASTGGVLESLYGGEEYGYAFVLIPKDQNYNAISNFIKSIFNKSVITQ